VSPRHWLGDDAYAPEPEPAVSRTACRNLRVLLRVESLDAEGEPMGNPVWLRGVAQLYADDGGTLEVRWQADKTGRYYTIAAEELAP
jgi:hypothetical protein